MKRSPRTSNMFMLLMLSQSASGDDLSSLTSSEGFNYSFELKRPTMKSYIPHLQSLPDCKQEKTNQVQQSWSKRHPLDVQNALDESTAHIRDTGYNGYPNPARSLQHSHRALLSCNKRCLAASTLAELLDKGDGTESDLNAAFRNGQWKTFGTAAPSMPSRKVEPAQWKLNPISSREPNQFKALTQFFASILEEDFKEKKSAGLAYGSDQFRTLNERLG